MGIGGGIFLIAVGAILAFAVHVEPAWLDLNVVGWVLMLAGTSALLITMWYWKDRRNRALGPMDVVDETRLAHPAAPLGADSEIEIRHPPAPPG
ncbi:hypothetical protein J2S43_006927 [Catenuloplanes nepalensis]|uniref:DUF6458 domain-containing protein n=1 Tax=Catenuloplanes nepalensis TaxID=587533 RepID=A0ABT9N3Y2_9ACTN|nr:DUF6458 family protein [Catenuloplanes nepalensis]MDP9798415.1 hypothetical protein [Catenuloplanes nepalensis]